MMLMQLSGRAAGVVLCCSRHNHGDVSHVAATASVLGEVFESVSEGL
mgnify:CR=1 FL=1